MKPYKAYMNAFVKSLSKIAVWVPGTQLNLGDYGEIKGKFWERKGSIWDLMPNTDKSLRECTSSTLDQLNYGSCQRNSINDDASYKGKLGKFHLTIIFDREHNLFVRTQDCESRYLNRLQAIAEALVKCDKWMESYVFVKEIFFAKRFLVLVMNKLKGKILVSATSSELLDEFCNGQLSTHEGIDISGVDVLKFLGRSGPIYMSLVKVSGPGVFNKNTGVQQVYHAEGSMNIRKDVVFVEDVLPKEFYDEPNHESMSK